MKKYATILFLLVYSFSICQDSYPSFEELTDIQKGEYGKLKLNVKFIASKNNNWIALRGKTEISYYEFFTEVGDVKEAMKELELKNQSDTARLRWQIGIMCIMIGFYLSVFYSVEECEETLPGYPEYGIEPGERCTYTRPLNTVASILTGGGLAIITSRKKSTIERVTYLQAKEIADEYNQRLIEKINKQYN